MRTELYNQGHLNIPFMSQQLERVINGFYRALRNYQALYRRKPSQLLWEDMRPGLPR